MFDLGDRVEYISDVKIGDIQMGYRGTVVSVSFGGGSIGVEFDMAIHQGHTCDGRCNDEHGWYLHPDSLRGICDDFRVGDRVEYSGLIKLDGGHLRAGDRGTIVYLESEDRGEWIGVRWDRNINGHSCGGECDVKHGWNVPWDSIRLIDSEIKDVFSDEEFFEFLTA